MRGPSGTPGRKEWPSLKASTQTRCSSVMVRSTATRRSSTIPASRSCDACGVAPKFGFSRSLPAASSAGSSAFHGKSHNPRPTPGGHAGERPTSPPDPQATNRSVATRSSAATRAALTNSRPPYFAAVSWRGEIPRKGRVKALPCHRDDSTTRALNPGDAAARTCAQKCRLCYTARTSERKGKGRQNRQKHRGNSALVSLLTATPGRTVDPCVLGNTVGRSTRFFGASRERRACAKNPDDGGRECARRGGGAAALAASPPKGEPRDRGRAHRVQHHELRGLYGFARRRVGQVLYYPGGAGRRARDHDDTGHYGKRSVAPDAAGVPRGTRAAVRVLHAGHDLGLHKPPRGEAGRDRGGDPGRARRQPLPLHGLREHREGSPDGAGPREPPAHAGFLRRRRVTEAPERYVGGGVLRKEDPALVTGRANWVDNIKLTGMLHATFLRSPYAHARITSIDTSAAKEQPGVVAVFTGEDLADEWVADEGLSFSAWEVTEDQNTPYHWPVARDEVNYAGEPVAVVVAADRYKAQDALELIEVDYDPLEPVLDVEKALEEGSPLVHEHFGTNECYTFRLGTGDIGDAFDKADVVVSERYLQQRLIPNAIETRGVVVQHDPGHGEFVMYTSTQIPHIIRAVLSTICGVGEHKLRVVAPDVGGGFGSKLNVYAEEAVALVLAKRLDAPVKWIEDRSENYLATTHGRGQVQYIELAATNEGKILGLRVKLLGDLGAYLQIFTSGTPRAGYSVYPGVYTFDAYSCEIIGVFTNKTATD